MLLSGFKLVQLQSNEQNPMQEFCVLACSLQLAFDPEQQSWTTWQSQGFVYCKTRLTKIRWVSWVIRANFSLRTLEAGSGKRETEKWKPETWIDYRMVACKQGVQTGEDIGNPSLHILLIRPTLITHYTLTLKKGAQLATSLVMTDSNDLQGRKRGIGTDDSAAQRKSRRHRSSVVFVSQVPPPSPDLLTTSKKIQYWGSYSSSHYYVLFMLIRWVTKLVLSQIVSKRLDDGRSLGPSRSRNASHKFQCNPSGWK